MENIDSYKYIYGEPFKGFYDTVIPTSVWNLNSEHLYSKEEINDIFQNKVKQLPIAKWNGNTIYEEDVLLLFKEKMESLKQITKDIEELKQSRNPYIKRFLSIVDYLTSNGIDISTFTPATDSVRKENEVDSNLIKEISSAKEIIRVSREVRIYISMMEYANVLSKQIEELTRIYDSLKAAPELDASDMSLCQDDKTIIKSFNGIK